MSNAARALSLVLMLAAAGLVLATAFALAARLWWAFDLFSHFRLQYALAALILLVAALALRNHRIAAVLALVALVHGWAIKDLWLGGSASAAPDGMNLRVISANVRAGNPTPVKVLELVRAHDADLVVLVEARGQRWRPVLSELGGFTPIGRRRPGAGARRSSCSAALQCLSRRWRARRGVGAFI